MLNVRSNVWLVMIGIISLLIAACATQGQFENVVNSWLGAPIERLTQGGWGMPDQKSIMANGNAEYKYNISKAQLPDTCLVFFEVDQNTQNIIHIRHEGNRCVQSPFN